MVSKKSDEGVIHICVGDLILILMGALVETLAHESWLVRDEVGQLEQGTNDLGVIGVDSDRLATFRLHTVDHFHH